MDKTFLSCRLTFLPLGPAEVGREVEVVLSIINSAPVRVETDSLGTNIFGEARDIFSLLERISSAAAARGTLFSLQVTLSNYCGCV